MYSPMYECSKHVFHIRKKFWEFSSELYGWNDLGGSQFWTSSAGGELGFTLSDYEEFLGSAFRFCFSCCTLKYELYRWCIVSCGGLPQTVTRLHWCDWTSPSARCYRSNHFFILPSWESNFSHKRRWRRVSDVRVPVETLWSFFFKCHFRCFVIFAVGVTLWSVCMTGSDWFHRDWYSSWFPTRLRAAVSCGSWVFWEPTFGSSRVVLPKQGPQAVHAIQRPYHRMCLTNFGKLLASVRHLWKCVVSTSIGLYNDLMWDVIWW